MNKILFKPTVAFKSALALLALGFTASGLQAQVINGGFENGPVLCTGGNNGPFYLQSGWVSNWNGVNMGTGSVNSPTNTGTVYDVTASCTLGRFYSGYAPAAGNRAININQSKSNGTYVNDIHAQSSLSPWVMGSYLTSANRPVYRVSVRLSGFPEGAAMYFPVENIVQVVVSNSSNSNPELVLGEFTVPNTHAWNLYTADIGSQKMPASSSYDRVEVRLKRTGTATAGSSVFVDDLSIVYTDQPGMAPIIPPGGGFSKASAKVPVGGLAGVALTQTKIWPNPANNQLEVAIDDQADLSNTILTIVNIEGAVVKTIQHPDSYNTSVDISALPSGMYFMKVTSGDETSSSTIKFVKQ